MCIHLTLDEKQAFLRVYTASQQQRIGLEGVFPERFCLLEHRDGVQIGERKDTIVLILQLNPIFDSAEIVFASACIKFLLLPTFAAVLVRFAEVPYFCVNTSYVKD